MYFYPVLHGVLIAFAYALIKYFDLQGNLMIFGNGVIAASIFILPWINFKTLCEIFKPILIVKGVLFGFTQILFFETLIKTGVGTVMVGSLFGGLVVAIFGMVFLSEYLHLKEYSGLLISFFGAFYYVIANFEHIDVSYFSIIAGLAQGVTATLTRKTTLSHLSGKSIVYSNLFWGGGVIYLWYAIANFESFVSGISHFISIETLLFSLVIVIVQISFFYMMKLSNTQLSSFFSLSRIPTSFSIDYFLFGIVATGIEIIAVLCIVTGIAISHFFKKEVLFFGKPSKVRKN